MDFAFQLVLYLIVAGVLVVATHPFQRTVNAFRLNRWGAAPFLIFLLIVVYTLHLQGWSQFHGGAVFLVIFLAWGSYFFLMCCYTYDGARYRWFNGLWRRSVDARSIRLVIWRRDKRRIAKVRFECDGRTLNTRTDMPDAVRLIRRMVEEHHLATKTERLPWWSV